MFEIITEQQWQTYERQLIAAGLPAYVGEIPEWSDKRRRLCVFPMVDSHHDWGRYGVTWDKYCWDEEEIRSSYEAYLDSLPLNIKEILWKQTLEQPLSATERQQLHRFILAARNGTQGRKRGRPPGKSSQRRAS